ncbi:MAG: VCBS repeat-containing protein [Planctomycetota bacterium]|nr:VCBS repeat-containing protein [Planctomycetota bacterium]
MSSNRNLSTSLISSVSGLTLLVACNQKPQPKIPTTPMEIQTERMTRSEALNIAWGKTGYLDPLAEALQSKKFPDNGCAKLFADSFVFTGIKEEFPDYDKEMNGGTAGKRHWELDDNEITFYNGAGEVPAGMKDWSEFDLYSSLFDEVDYFKSAKFKVHLPVPRWIDPDTMTQWQVGFKFTAKAKLKNGRLAEIKGWQDVIWEHDPSTRDEIDPEKQIWKIISWKINSLATIETDDWLFEEVLDNVIPDEGQLELARQSIHEEQVRDFLKARKAGKKFEKPYPQWQVAAGERHPTVSIVDLNDDGFDDFYVQERHGRNLFFQNNGNGTFSEIGRELGLDFDGQTSSATFSDFDNDGDKDVFIGGSLRRSIILENVDGRFVNRSGDWVSEENLPFNTGGATVVDFNGDGLNDIYISTYAAYFAQRAIKALQGDAAVKSSGEGDERVMTSTDYAVNELRAFMREKDFDKLMPLYVEAAEGSTLYRSRPGPPNLLLVNTGGGKFEEHVLPDELRIFHNTFQTTWSDIDNDGDYDFYSANDFAPNYLIRNDGNGKFTDITDVADVADVGFGMGVAFGDYDNDGFQDLYVTNMFSKAARRVTSFFTPGRVNYDAELLQGEGIDPLFEQLGRGNSMFHNDGSGKWAKVSEKGQALHSTEFGGWGWGAQFADFNNDGFLDLYGPAGYYTAPKDQKRNVDL